MRSDRAENLSKRTMGRINGGDRNSYSRAERPGRPTLLSLREREAAIKKRGGAKREGERRGAERRRAAAAGKTRTRISRCFPDLMENSGKEKQRLKSRNTFRGNAKLKLAKFLQNQ